MRRYYYVPLLAILAAATVASAQPQQPQHVRDGDTVLADPAGNFLLSKPKFHYQLLVGLGLFYGIQVFALQVLD